MAANERTLARPLSGAEVRQAILNRIEAQLARDCFLVPHLGYASFSFQAEIRIQFQYTGTSIRQTQVNAQGKGGNETDDPVESVDVHVAEEPKPPNEVRVDSGQGVPTIARSATGKVEERRVRYDQKELATQKAAAAAKKAKA
jgi:hypothetical protein